METVWHQSGSWEGWVPFLDCSSSVQAVFSLKLCGLSSLNEVLLLPSMEALILQTMPALWSH